MENEGKTKTLTAGEAPHTVILTAKDVLTAGDAARVADMPDLGIVKTRQAANVFRYLNGVGLPTAFIDQVGERSLLCWACDMLPMEFVGRRYAWGSYLRRHPRAQASAPARFDEVVVERFHKHSLIVPPAAERPNLIAESKARSLYLRDGKWAEGVHTDPLVCWHDDEWLLYSAKEPFDARAPRHRIHASWSRAVDDEIVREILVPAFLALERAWSAIRTSHGPVVLADCKFEIGRRKSDGRLVLADVVDNDSWRVWPGGNPSMQIDKQCFRDNAPLAHVTDVYTLVERLTGEFTRPAHG